MTDENQDRWFGERILKRFLSYVTIETASDRHSKESPTTPGQWKLAKNLVRELKKLGVDNVELDENTDGTWWASVQESVSEGMQEHFSCSAPTPASALRNALLEACDARS